MPKQVSNIFGHDYFGVVSHTSFRLPHGSAIVPVCGLFLSILGENFRKFWYSAGDFSVTGREFPLDRACSL